MGAKGYINYPLTVMERIQRLEQDVADLKSQMLRAAEALVKVVDYLAELEEDAAGESAGRGKSEPE